MKFRDIGIQMVKLSNLKCWNIQQRDFQIIDIEVQDKLNLLSSKKQEIDCSGLIGIPSGIDTHVHFREPGFEHKEDMLTGALTALNGGVTTVLDMANNNPITDSVESILQKKKLAEKQQFIDILIASAITNRNYKKLDEIDPFCDAYKIFLPEFEGDLKIDEERISISLASLEEIETGRPIIIQAEDQEIISRYNNKETHQKQRPPEAETIAFQKIFNWAKDFRSLKMHATLLSNSLSIKMLEMTHLPNLTSDTSFRYLLFDVENVPPEYAAKVNPPFRSKMDRNLLLKAFATGLIEIICSDHAPHTLEEKAKNNPSGIPGIQEILPTLVTKIKQSELEWDRVIEAFHIFPAKLLDIEIDNYHARNLVILDENVPFKISKDWVKTKVKWSALQGQNMFGRIHFVIKDGILKLHNTF